jgi:hypothetical protein
MWRLKPLAAGADETYGGSVRDLRVPGALLVLGFGGILAWTVTYLIAVLPTPYMGTTLVYWLTTTAGYGLAGFACWRWIVGSWKAREGAPVRGPSRWMAAASFMTAVGVAALTFETYQNRPSYALTNLDLHYGLRLVGELAGTLGFVLAAVGFWAASLARPLHTEEGHAQALEPEEKAHAHQSLGTER